MAQVESWLLNGDVQRLVVVVSGVDTGETLERWQFKVNLDDDNMASGEENRAPNTAQTNQTTKKNKTTKEIHGEIQAIIRQITASVTFLPLLNEPCSFDLLVYTKKDAAVPQKWEDSDPCYILNSQEVKLRSFTTSVSSHDNWLTQDDWISLFFIGVDGIFSHITFYRNVMQTVGGSEGMGGRQIRTMGTDWK